MTWKHITALLIAGVLYALAGLIVFLCGNNPVCSAPSTIGRVETMATVICTAATTLVGGVIGDWRSSQAESRADTKSSRKRA